MRVGRVGDQRARIIGHCLGHIGVQIEGDHDRNLRSEPAAQPRQKLAFGVFVTLADHRAVQMQ